MKWCRLFSFGVLVYANFLCLTLSRWIWGFQRVEREKEKKFIVELRQQRACVKCESVIVLVEIIQFSPINVRKILDSANSSFLFSTKLLMSFSIQSFVRWTEFVSKIGIFPAHINVWHEHNYEWKSYRWVQRIISFSCTLYSFHQHHWITWNYFQLQLRLYTSWVEVEQEIGMIWYPISNSTEPPNTYIPSLPADFSLVALFAFLRANFRMLGKVAGRRWSWASKKKEHSKKKRRDENFIWIFEK